jgi:hypothetical protein
MGKTSPLDAACGLADGLGHEILWARGSELEAHFAFGVVRQLFERRVASAEVGDREWLLAGPAGPVRPLLLGEVVEAVALDTSFAGLHGLYWLTANLADRRPVLVAVDDAHWADEPSLRWLAYIAARTEGLALALIVALRPSEPTSTGASVEALRARGAAVVRPALLSEDAVAAIVRGTFGGGTSDELCAALCAASGGNPLNARRSHSTSPRYTRRCFDGWTRWTCSNGHWPSAARPTRRSRPGSRASSWSVGSMTRVARRGSRRCSSVSPPARRRVARRRRAVAGHGHCARRPTGERGRCPAPS